MWTVVKTGLLTTVTTALSLLALALSHISAKNPIQMSSRKIEQGEGVLSDSGNLTMGGLASGTTVLRPQTL